MRRLVIDSHVHLWPQSMANSDGHRWMQGSTLAREHVLSEYNGATSNNTSIQIEGLIFIETDAHHDFAISSNMLTWAKGPLDEIRFLRSIHEDAATRQLIKGVVIWAPVMQSPRIFKDWLSLAEETAGAQLWSIIRGVRYLVQGISDRSQFEQLMRSSDFIENLRLLGRRRLCFDVGVDQRSAGTWQLRLFSLAIEEIHRGVPSEDQTVFILNHLCKSDFSQPSQAFEAWKEVTTSLSRLPRVFMKLSGAFSELPESWIDGPDAIARHIRPWVEHALLRFGSERVMFGSDWPVCNSRAISGQDMWTAWAEVVLALLENISLDLSDDEKAFIWRKTALKAYGIKN